MTDLYKEALELHKEKKGKLAVVSKVPCETQMDLSLAYTPGVAEPCRKIHENQENSYVYTNRGNTVAVVSDGTAVLGLGDIGPYAAMPVMEGKALLMKKFANIDAWPICIDSKDPEEIIRFVKMMSPSFGAVNLEDISAPRCIEIERRLIEELDIPVFHDDQHGTAIVVLAALINAMKLKKTKPEDQKVVVSGCGAAGSSIIRTLYNYGFHKIYAFDALGNLDSRTHDSYNSRIQELYEYVNKEDQKYDSLAEGMKGADIFIGVSRPGLVTKEMVASMNEGCIVFPMANPESEINYDDAKEAGAYIVGTGRSDHPNQINNLLAFPGIFRGALDYKATKITDGMKIAASMAIADMLNEKELNKDHIIISPFEPGLVEHIAKAVGEQAVKEGVVRK